MNAKLNSFFLRAENWIFGEQNFAMRFSFILVWSDAILERKGEAGLSGGVASHKDINFAGDVPLSAMASGTLLQPHYL